MRRVLSKSGNVRTRRRRATHADGGDESGRAHHADRQRAQALGGEPTEVVGLKPGPQPAGRGGSCHGTPDAHGQRA